MLKKILFICLTALLVMYSLADAQDRYLVFGGNGVHGDTTAPTLTFTGIWPGGAASTNVFSEDVVYVGGTATFTCSDAGTVDLTYSSGTGAYHYLSTSETIYAGDTCTLNMSAGYFEDTSGNPIAAISGGSVTNNSTQVETPVTEYTEYYVTQSGAGSYSGTSLANAYSVANFNALTGDYSDSIFYFSGTITSRVIPQIYGTSGAPAIMDGYEAGEQDPCTNGSSTGSAIINNSSTSGLYIESNDWLTVQDFEITGYAGVLIQGNAYGETEDWAEHVSFYRNWIHDTSNDSGLQATEQVSGGYARTSTKYFTFGGSNGNGNFVDNCKYGTTESHMFGMNYYEDALISYNRFGFDDPLADTGKNCVAIHIGERILIEHNEIYNAQGDAGISMKEYGPVDFIIRYNYVHDCVGTTNGMGISLSRDSDTGLVYGNYIYNCRRGIICMKDSANHRVFANVIDSCQTRGIDIQIGTTGTWSTDNSYFYNNTIANCNSGRPGYSLSAWDSGIWSSVLTGSNGIFVKNNIFYNNAKTTAYVELTYFDYNPVDSDYNVVYNPSGTAHWVRGTSLSSNVYTLAQMQAFGLETNSVVSSPNFTTPTSVYTLTSTSPARNTGLTVTDTMPTLVIRGLTYGPNQSGDYYVNYDIGLAPSMTRSQFAVWPTTVSTLLQGDEGSGWERGAYIYEE